MKALVYLLGARALDVAQDRDETRLRRTEDVLPPLASTPATASAWRRWSENREATITSIDTARRDRSRAPAPRTTSA